MSEVPKLERFNKKNRSLEMINFFLYCIKKMKFSSSPKGRIYMEKYGKVKNLYGNVKNL